MKMHSYMNIYGYLSHINQQAQTAMEQLRMATLKLGSWEDALAAAEMTRRERESSSTDDDAPTNDGPTVDSPASSSSDAQPTLRKRRVPLQRAGSTPLAPAAETNPAQILTTGNHVLSPEDVLKPAPHALVDHPDEEIASLAREYSELDSELVSTGPEYIRWPNNITLKNFATYMVIPTLVYELEYPRTDRCVDALVALRASLLTLS